MAWGGMGKSSWGKSSWGKGSNQWGNQKGWAAGAGGPKGWMSGVKGVQQTMFTKGGGSLATSVPEDFHVNTKQKYTGTVEAYWKLKGYGFIVLDKKGVAPNDKVFVHWEDLQSDDRFPMLHKGMKVRFNITKQTKHGATSLRAANVTLPDGNQLALQDEDDSKKTYVGGQHLRYSGTLNFYIPKRGYGYITIDDGYDYDGEPVPQDIRVEKAEMNSDGANAAYMKDVQVEFGIWQTKKGAYKAYNVTAPGGNPLPADE
eukprot:TRINITY_DN3539_c0_g1_i1.p1 TRINITY_DN3539_c0_g1~~TRINITY_DN3539_c0_g1_i1.p1  ORF type:complete len:258 (+),score=35.30 TRINITY_DN3539_c0_g1_i1:83-856(+)